MAITRLNYFTAKPGQRDALAGFLSHVLGVIRQTEGCIECRLLCDQADPAELVILERWESEEAHQRAASVIPKERIGAVIQYLEKPPTGEYLVARL